MTRNEFIINRVKEHYDEACSLGYEVVAVFLQGSQNYMLDDYTEEQQSDVDTKCITISSLSDLICGKVSMSSVHACANREHIDLKDLRVVFDLFQKQNAYYIELLFTKYYYVNPKYAVLVQELLSLAEAIARMSPNATIRFLAADSQEKLNLFERQSLGPLGQLSKQEPVVLSPRAKRIKQFGYDPKQLHHLLRLNDLTRRFVTNAELYRDILIPQRIDYLKQVKNGLYSLNDAREVAFKANQDTQCLKIENLMPGEPVNLETARALEALKQKFIQQFLNETSE